MRKVNAFSPKYEGNRTAAKCAFEWRDISTALLTEKSPIILGIDVSASSRVKDVRMVVSPLRTVQNPWRRRE